jgi:hypothetical protein
MKPLIPALFRQAHQQQRAAVRLLLLAGLLLATLSITPLMNITAQEGLPPFRIDPSLPADIAVNANQGLGQCHWLASNILSQPYVSWAYDASPAISSWSVIEPESGVFNWDPLDAEIAKARALGKRIWLELHTSEGQTPQWARDAGVVVVGSRGGVPVPWNETYQRLLRRAVHAMAARYDDDPTVDAINVAAGGCYGEMSICSASTDKKAWEQAGYTDERFIEAVKQIIDIYLEPEIWDFVGDPTLGHGFVKTPVVLQLGSGLYGHTISVIQPVAEYAMSKYGMRVWLKYNGFGSGYDMGWLYEQYAATTRVGYEPAGNSLEFLMKPGEFMQTALEQHTSFLCLQETYYAVSDPKWEDARTLAARHLGAQIVTLGADAPPQVLAGQEWKVVTHWVNRGTTPLMRPERQGVKDVPASYDIAIALVDTMAGSVVWEDRFTPSIPTTQWYSATPVRIEQALTVPVSVAGGSYDLRVALVNPNLAEDNPQRRLRLVNVELDDGSSRYTVGRVRVLNEPTPTAAPVPTPASTAAETVTPSTGSSGWLGRLLSTICDWVRSLFAGLS